MMRFRLMDVVFVELSDCLSEEFDRIVPRSGYALFIRLWGIYVTIGKSGSFVKQCISL